MLSCCLVWALLGLPCGTYGVFALKAALVSPAESEDERQDSFGQLKAVGFRVRAIYATVRGTCTVAESAPSGVASYVVRG